MKPCDLHDCPCWCKLTNTPNPEYDEEVCRHAWTLREIERDRQTQQEKKL